MAWAWIDGLRGLQPCGVLRDQFHLNILGVRLPLNVVNGAVSVPPAAR
jgi:hypothetical protein